MSRGRRTSHLARAEMKRDKLGRQSRGASSSLDSRRERANIEAERLRRQRWVIRRGLLLAGVFAVVGTWLYERYFNEPSPVVVPPQVWAEGPVFGADAVLAAGAKEAETPMLAPLTGLAAGSLTAQQAQLKLANDKKWPVEIVNSLGMRFRLIPAGTFVMGSPTTEVGREGDEAARPMVVADPYYMGMFEVTRGQYEELMGTLPEKEMQPPLPDQPVVEVTWHEAKAFAKALSEREGVAEWVYRLPTEMEWEYACRAGTESPFCFGSDVMELEKYAVYKFNTVRGWEPVGSGRANAWGVYDMHGNVWEWCEELFYYYENPDIIDPLRRVLRGGHWQAEALDCRSAARFRLPPDSRSNLLGFRLVCSIYEPPEPKEKVPVPW